MPLQSHVTSCDETVFGLASTNGWASSHLTSPRQDFVESPGNQNNRIIMMLEQQPEAMS
eukprot:m.17376 g.17376  ORF g.17376 m.17376 type:complete len:59 (-) comp7432_c0_seq1:70-246(-)